MNTLFLLVINFIIIVFVAIVLGVLIFKKIILNLCFGQALKGVSTRRILEREKSIFLRHKNNELTDYEINTIKPLCSEEIFPYYYFVCPTENFWEDIKTKLNTNEIIDILTVSHNIDFENPSNPMDPILTVITNQNRLIMYSVNPDKVFEFDIYFRTNFSFDDIKEINYEIQPKMTEILRHAIPVEAFIKLKNDNIIHFPCSANIIELIVDKIPDRNLLVNGLLKAEIQNLTGCERQLNELNKLLKEDKIRELEFDMLLKRVYKTVPQIYQEIYEERALMYTGNEIIE